MKQLSNPKVEYLLASVDLEKRTGVFKMRNEGTKKWTKLHVALSGLLVSRIERGYTRDLRMGDSFVGTIFCSEVDSRKYHENPFKLVEYRPIGKSDAPVHYILQMVDQKYNEKYEIMDAMGNRIVKIKSGFLQPWQFYRYVQYSVEKTLHEIFRNPNATIIDPVTGENIKPEIDIA